MRFSKQIVALAVNAALSEPAERFRRGWNRRRRAGRPVVELFHQVDDPHGYLLVQALLPLRAIDLRVWLVPPPANSARPDLQRAWGLRDSRELARRCGLDFPANARSPSRPEADLAQAILANDPQLALAARIGEALFAGLIDRVTARKASPEETARVLAEGARRRQRLGHYAGAMIHCEGEWYWGIDRLHYLIDRLRADGIEIGHRPRPTAVAPGPSGARAVDFFFSFRSPYSYLAIGRIAAIAEERGAALTIKPVLPMAMRGLAVPWSKRRYILTDAAREARRLGVPFGRACDPLGAGVLRCLALWHWARANDKELAFIRSAARGIWSEAKDVATDRDLAFVVERAGLPWSEARAHLADESWRAETETNRADLFSLGLWGVPSFRVGAHSTWGQDRLDWVANWLSP